RKDLFRLQKWADERLTPLEIASLRGRTYALPDEMGQWLSRFDHLPKPHAVEPQTYQARDIAPGIFLFAGTTGTRATKSLLLAFSTGMHGLLMPTAFFLQYLPSARFDVLMLQDESRSHFERGIRPYA